jgi:hypothetical protein
MTVRNKLASRGRRLAVQLAGLVLITGIGGFTQVAPDPWLILPGSDDGPITKHTTREDLVHQYGVANVSDRDVDVGEGETEPGTVVFSSDPQRTIEILWRDPAAKRAPKQVQIHGQVSLWKTAHGISLGTSLKELEHINGGPFLLLGFEWDYSGTVTSWKGGTLEKKLPGTLEKDPPGNGRVILRLDSPFNTNISGSESAEVAGDREFSSQHPVMQKINPHVYQIIWQFP